MGFADMFNRRPSPGKGSAPVIHMPSLNACSKFNIQRRGADSRYYMPLQFGGWGFLRGVQFTDIRNPLAGLINPNLLSLTKPEIPRSDRTNSVSGVENYLMDELILEFIGNLPYSVKPEKLGAKNSGNKVGIGLAYSGPNISGPPPAEAIVRIVPSDTDWLKFSTSHTWDDPGGVMSKIFDVINGIAGAVADFTSIVSKVGSSFNGERAQQKNVPVKDVSDSYISSEKQEITVPFTLFTAAGSIDDFMNDIYFPVMFMNMWSSPRRVNDTDALREHGKKLLASIGSDSDNTTGGGDGVGSIQTNPSAASDVDTASGQAGGASRDTSLEDKVLEVFTSWPGYRVAMLGPPSYIRVSHSSGLFSFPKCAIANFEYNYKGPWVNTNALIEKMQLPYSVLVGLRKFLPRQIPTVCECSLNLKVLDHTFADDWLAMFNNSSITKLATGSQNLVNVLNGRPSEREANGFNFPVEQF